MKRLRRLPRSRWRLSLADFHSDDSRRIGILTANLVLLGVCILGLAAAALIYSLFVAPRRSALPAETISPTPRPSLIPSATPTITQTPTQSATPRPSLTVTPSLTPTHTPTPGPSATPTPFPQLTPARPAVTPDSYRLHTWSPDEADYAGRVIQGYPASLELASTTDPGYREAFRYPVLAWREALLRFPDVPQAIDWRWNLAKDLTRSGSSEAGEAYARVIAAGLNRGDTDLTNLYDWFISHAPDLELYLTDIKPPGTYVAAYVVALTGDPGSIFVWLLQSPSGFVAYPLETRLSALEPPASDRGRPAQAVNWIIADLNGDPKDGDEVAIYSGRPDADLRAGFPSVYNLSAVPARRMPFLPPGGGFRMGVDFVNYWSLERVAGGRSRLVFRGEAFPTCPITVEQSFTWNGEYFQPAGPVFSIKPNPSTLAFCAPVVDHAAALWGPEAAAGFMEALKPGWPPPLDFQGNPFPPDARDEFDYRLAIFNALTGRDQAAIDLMNRISTQPAIPLSRWITPAQRFLGAFRSADDLYRACLLALPCDPAEAIRRLTRSADPGADVFELLKRRGLNPTASGFFDFDGDDQAERWFTTRYRERYKNQLWILAVDEIGVQAIDVGPVEMVPPRLTVLQDDFIAPEGLALKPVSFLENTSAFTMKRLPDTGAAYLLPVPLRAEYPSKFFLPLSRAREALLNGGSPKEIQVELENLADYPGLLCRPTWTCDEYYYYLGLAAELSGDERAAVEAYHRLWLDYSRSPLTILARLKLAGEALPTAAPSPTPTPGPTTPTPGPTPTGPTPTPSPTQATPTPTQATPYEPYYPYYPYN